ncbi:beta-1,3-glucosyltransferase [Dermacentor albipictus]|uniref:beta-1,3-glucosyltransferase n=1 Tax=Dermacentor albipictus TaxID=60249 RepID=UPI0031FCC1EB
MSSVSLRTTLLLFLCFTSCTLWRLGACVDRDAGIVFVVLSQDSAMSSKAAEQLSSSIAEQAAALKMVAPTVYLLHKQWPDVAGAWTVFPLIKRLEMLHRKDGRWFFFCEDTTGVELSLLHKALHRLNSTQEAQFVGHALWDEETTIVHHFDDPRSLAYPDLSAGMALSEAAMQRVAEALDIESPEDFSIDRQYEIAKFLRDHCGGLLLEHAESFCLGERSEGCATWTSVQAPSCAEHVPKEALTVAVKTCNQFHKDRVPVIKATWAGDAHRVLFFSDVEDDRVPTVTVGVANVERGHCAKTLAILRHVVSHGLLERWLLVADDDSLISIPRLLDLLSCFDWEDDVALGERYGFGAATGRGYDYLTGGSGMVFSRKTVERIINSPCSCSKADSPDDMTLGVCLKQLGVPITHSPLFHQARPDDYSRQLLSHQRPISFHKFWMMDPVAAYRKWLADIPYNATRHEEL